MMFYFKQAAGLSSPSEMGKTEGNNASVAFLPFFLHLGLFCMLHIYLVCTEPPFMPVVHLLGVVVWWIFVKSTL